MGAHKLPPEAYKYWARSGSCTLAAVGAGIPGLQSSQVVVCCVNERVEGGQKVHGRCGASTSAHTKEGAQEQNVCERGHEIVLLLTEGLEMDRDQEEEQEHQQRHEEP